MLHGVLPEKSYKWESFLDAALPRLPSMFLADSRTDAPRYALVIRVLLCPKCSAINMRA